MINSPPPRIPSHAWDETNDIAPPRGFKNAAFYGLIVWAVMGVIVYVVANYF